MLDNFFNLGFAVTNASRKVFLGLLGINQANNLNTNGLALFGAAVAWVLPSVPPVRPVLAATAGPGARQMTLGWTSSGTLKTATNLAAPAWITAPNQANPQTVPTTNPQRYYRVKQ